MNGKMKLGKTGSVVIVFMVLFSTFYLGAIFDAPYIDEPGEKFWEETKPYWKETRNSLEKIYQKILGNGEETSTEEESPSEEQPGGEETEEGPSLEPPNITTSISLQKTSNSSESYGYDSASIYLGDYPTFEITVTNNGGPCEVEYTAFETQPQTGSFHLGSNESKTVTETREQIREIGSWEYSVDVTATNEDGTDQASDWTNFNVTFHHIDGKDFVPEDEKNQSIGYLDKAELWLKGELRWNEASAYDYLIKTNSETIQGISEELTSYNPYDTELQAKEIYYWVSNYIAYDDWAYANKDKGESLYETPPETIYDQDGVCLNKAAVLASLYESAGLDAKLILLWNGGANFWEDRDDYHAAVLLYMPNTPEYHHPFGDEWISLDSTKGKEFGTEYGTTYDHYDIADVE